MMFLTRIHWRVLSLLALLTAAVSCLAAPSGALDLQGKAVDPLQASHGKIVVLLFVRTDCPVSSRYAPTIEALSKWYAQDAEFWLVDPDKTEQASAVKKYLADYSYSLPALRDPEHVLVARSQVKITPEAAVFDTHGKLVYHGRIDNWYADFGRARPAPTTHELSDAIRDTIAGRTPQVNSAQAVGCYISDLD